MGEHEEHIAFEMGYNKGFKDGIKGSIPKADYETRLKADMVAMLTELQLEIEEKFNDRPFSYNHHQRTEFYRDIDEVIQQKIDKLKEG
jgi:hypothetical protein